MVDRCQALGGVAVAQTPQIVLGVLPGRRVGSHPAAPWQCQGMLLWLVGTTRDQPTVCVVLLVGQRQALAVVSAMLLRRLADHPRLLDIRRQDSVPVRVLSCDRCP